MFCNVYNLLIWVGILLAIFSGHCFSVLWFSCSLLDFLFSCCGSLPFEGHVSGFLPDSVTLRCFLVFLQDSFAFFGYFRLPSGLFWPSAIPRVSGLPSGFLASSDYLGFLPDYSAFWSSFKILCLPWILFQLLSGFRVASCGLLRTPVDSCGFLAFLRDTLSPQSLFGLLSGFFDLLASFKILLPSLDFLFVASFWILVAICDFLWAPGLPSRFFAFLGIYFGFLPDSLTCCGCSVFLRDSYFPQFFIWLPSGPLTFI